MKKTFSIVCCDIPWSFDDSLNMSDVARGAEANYNVMSIKDIKAIPVKDIADANGCLLALWVPSSLLQEGLDVMTAWGFNHRQTYIWVKTKKDTLKTIRQIASKALQTYKKSSLSIKDYSNILLELISSYKLESSLGFGMGRLFRQTHEICLIGINNNKIYKNLTNKSQRSVSFGENKGHSIKPENLQDSLDLMFNDPLLNRIEIFARRQRKGWWCFGNESPMSKGEDIRDSLKKLSSISDDDFKSIQDSISSYDSSKDERLYNLWNDVKI